MTRLALITRHVVAVGIVGAVAAMAALSACTVTSTTAPQPEQATPETPSPTDVPATATPTPTAVGEPPVGTPTSIPALPGPGTGDWVKPNPSGKADGEACKKPDDCKSGVCEGMGCDTGPKCVAANRPCTRDLRTYCGCDNQTFGGSGTCPGRPYKKAGECSK